MRRQHHKERNQVDECGAAQKRAREVGLAKLATRQHGVVTRAQLVRLGFDARAIDRRVASGRLHRVHRGVYLVGHRAAPQYAREMAAVLACGAGAVVSDRSAAALWQLLPYPAPAGDVEVTVPARDPGTKPGIHIHRVRRLDERDVRTLKGVPITAPARTLLDLAAALPKRDVERAVAEGEVRGLARRRELVALLARTPRHRSAGALRRIVESDADPTWTRSEAEQRFLALLRKARLPAPRVNARLGRYEVDFLWREEQLVVEVDGFRYHGSRAAFERDRVRDAELGARGFRVIRVTWRQIVEEPEAMLVRIATALARSCR